MIKIQYDSHKGNPYERRAWSTEQAAYILKQLFKARIKAFAYEGINLIGAVEIMNNKLTWLI